MFWDWSDIIIRYTFPTSKRCCSDNVAQRRTSGYSNNNFQLISDKDENAINKGKHFVLFHLSKYSDKLYGNIVYKLQIEMSNFIKVPASLVFATTSEFWFSRFSRFTMYKLTTAVTTFLIACLIKSNNEKLDQIIFHVSDNLMVHGKTTDEWHTNGIQVHTSDIRVIYEYIRVIYRWHTSTYEWHTDDIWVTYAWHASTYEWHTGDMRMT